MDGGVWFVINMFSSIQAIIVKMQLDVRVL